MECIGRGAWRRAWAPRGWSRAAGFTLPKGNDAAGCAGERLVVQLCAAGRSFVQVLLDEAPQPPWPPQWAYGCIPGRRREAAMLVQK
eukprot:6572748-Lingulodinium_polyedra.AAC.1